MEIDIEDYLSKEDIKEIVAKEVRTYVRQSIGRATGSSDNGQSFISKLAKSLAKEGVQEIIPNFNELINNHIVESINKITLSDFFVSSFGWSSPGNKVLNKALSDNKDLIDAKIKQIFAKV